MKTLLTIFTLFASPTIALACGNYRHPIVVAPLQQVAENTVLAYHQALYGYYSDQQLKDRLSVLWKKDAVVLTNAGKNYRSRKFADLLPSLVSERPYIQYRHLSTSYDIATKRYSVEIEFQKNRTRVREVFEIEIHLKGTSVAGKIVQKTTTYLSTNNKQRNNK